MTTCVEPLNVSNQNIVLPGNAANVLLGCHHVLPERLCLLALLP